MTKHPKLTASSTSAPPGANEHDATRSAQKSPQGSQDQGEDAIYFNAVCHNREVAEQHLDEISARRRTLLERLAET
jgi:hypothetical protein